MAPCPRLPPPAMAPPAAPTPVTTRLRSGVGDDFLRPAVRDLCRGVPLQAPTTSGVGIAGEDGAAWTVWSGAGLAPVGLGGWIKRVLAGVEVGRSAVSFVPDQFATTRPVTSAVAMTRAMANAVTFHGSHLSITSLPCRRHESRRPRRRSSRLRERSICHCDCRWRPRSKAHRGSGSTWRPPGRGSFAHEPLRLHLPEDRAPRLAAPPLRRDLLQRSGREAEVDPLAAATPEL